MKTIFKVIAWLSLAALVIPSFLFLANRMSMETVRLIMLIATVVWFFAAGFGMWLEDSKT